MLFLHDFLISMCLLYVSLGSRVSPSIFGLMFMGSVMYSKRHRLQAMELSQRTQAAVQIMSNLSAPSNGGPDLPFFGNADPMDGWRCGSQKRVMSRPIQVRQL